MANHSSGKAHHQWKGGRRIGTNGYIVIWLPIGHHLRGKNGTGYEHRLVAEKKYGRRLRRNESVHHVDGNKQNNDPSNIVLCKSEAHHRVFHRTCGFNRQLPDEGNPIIECACGCGRAFTKYDKWHRPRKFWSGCRPGGQSHSQAKLDIVAVQKIKNHKGLMKDIALKFGVSRYTVGAIKSGRTWSKQK